jgi:hypothetical protein
MGTAFRLLSTLVGCTSAGLLFLPAAVADPAGPPGCGVIADPDNGAAGFGYVAVVRGDVTCQEAMALIDRYYQDATLEHNGNSWSAEVDGWGCRLPNAMAREYGWREQCTRGTADQQRNGTADEVQIRFLPDGIAAAPGS